MKKFLPSVWLCGSAHLFIQTRKDLKSGLVICFMLEVKREDTILSREYMVVSRRARGEYRFRSTKEGYVSEEKSKDLPVSFDIPKLRLKPHHEMSPMRFGKRFAIAFERNYVCARGWNGFGRDRRFELIFGNKACR